VQDLEIRQLARRHELIHETRRQLVELQQQDGQRGGHQGLIVTPTVRGT
jgi:hypothetical protein